MTTQQFVGRALWSVLGLALFAAAFEGSLAYETTDALFTLAGIGMFVFGIWAGILLNKK